MVYPYPAICEEYRQCFRLPLFLLLGEGALRWSASKGGVTSVNGDLCSGFVFLLAPLSVPVSVLCFFGHRALTFAVSGFDSTNYEPVLDSSENKMHGLFFVVLELEMERTWRKLERSELDVHRRFL